MEIKIGSIKGKLNGIHFTLQMCSKEDVHIPINIPGDNAEKVLNKQQMKNFEEIMAAFSGYYFTENGE
jgi:hypothetical protein